MTVFVLTCAGKTKDDAREQVRPLIASAIASGKIDVQLAPMGIMSQIQELRDSGDPNYLAAAIPDNWIDQLAIVGTPSDWKSSIDRFIDAGADTVVLVPLPNKSLDEINIFANHYLT